MTEILIITDMGGLQHFQMRVIFAGAIPFNDFMPDSIDKGVEVLNLHGGNPIYIENLKIALAFVMLVGVLLLITGEATLLSAFSLIAPPIIALLMVSCVRKESASKWEKYKLTLPVRRKAIIESQYISHTIWSISGVVIVAVFMTLTVFIHGDQYFYYGFRDAITLVLGGGILAILIGAFSYPLYYLWGAEKTEVILIISVIGSIGIVFALTMLVNTFSDGNVSDTLYYISLLVVTAITIITFIFSCVLTKQIFQHCEY